MEAVELQRGPFLTRRFPLHERRSVDAVTRRWDAEGRDQSRLAGGEARA